MHLRMQLLDLGITKHRQLIEYGGQVMMPIQSLTNQEIILKVIRTWREMQ